MQDKNGCKPAFIRAEEAPGLIHDGATIWVAGFGLAGVAEEVLIAIEKSFLETGHPRDLTFYVPPAIGNYNDRGMAHMAHVGLTKRVVAGHFGGEGPAMQKLVAEGLVEAYNFPQGVLATMPRNIAARRPGVLTKIGMYTFADPRVEGAKANSATREDLIEVVEFDGEEWLYYRLPKIDVGLIRGNIADLNGNLVMNKDGILVESMAIAQATRACGGIVIGEAETYALPGTLHPKEVRVPGILVDYMVQSKPENHLQTMGTYFNPAFCGDVRVPTDAVKPLPMGERKIIARRAAMELSHNTVVNLGVGMPGGVANITAEEGVGETMSMSVESGIVGGIPASSKLDFANSVNAEAIIEHAAQFDFYDSGGLDLAILGLAEADAAGNVNVSKFNGSSVGCGGFVNLTQSTETVVFIGTFTAGGLEIRSGDGKLTILKEGKVKKFKQSVEQITFSGRYAQEIGQKILFVTERAVFKVTEAGMELIEMAPGVDLERDILAHMEFQPIVRDVKPMPAEIFHTEWGGLAAWMDAKLEQHAETAPALAV